MTDAFSSMSLETREPLGSLSLFAVFFDLRLSPKTELTESLILFLALASLISRSIRVLVSPFQKRRQLIVKALEIRHPFY